MLTPAEHAAGTGAGGFDGDLSGLIPMLLSAGLLSPADSVLGRIELQPIGRSHPVFCLQINGQPRAAIKLFSPSRGGTDGEPARERAAHDLAIDLPELARLLPTRIEHAGPDWLLAQEWFDGTPAWSGDALDSGSGDSALDLQALAARLAAPLAGLHRASARRLRGKVPLALQSPEPWPLRMFDSDGPAELWAFPELSRLLRECSVRRRLVTGLRRARGAWRPRSLIHGDLKHDNILLGHDERIALIDWEMARFGDPAWDLAGLLLRPLLDPQTEGFGESQQRAAHSLLDAYRTGDDGPSPALAQRLLLYCGAWLFMSLVQSQSVGAVDAASCERLLVTAEDCLLRADDFAERIEELSHVT